MRAHAGRSHAARHASWWSATRATSRLAHGGRHDRCWAVARGPPRLWHAPRQRGLQAGTPRPTPPARPSCPARATTAVFWQLLCARPGPPHPAGPFAGLAGTLAALPSADARGLARATWRRTEPHGRSGLLPRQLAPSSGVRRTVFQMETFGFDSHEQELHLPRRRSHRAGRRGPVHRRDARDPDRPTSTVRWARPSPT
jgi:hypothetical protein